MANPKLSKASKMPCPSWSLQAIDTCPGSIGADGELVDACKGCYATDGNYRFKNVIAPRKHNQQDWKSDDWADVMTDLISKHDYFRWFDSGDVYTVKLAEKILQVMQRTPGTKHWLPTRMHKFAKFADVFARMQALSNVVIRFSSDGINGETIKGRNTSTIIPDHDSAQPGMTVCEAYTRAGKCADCRACWDKDVSVIAYPQHGRKMRSVAIKLAA